MSRHARGDRRVRRTKAQLHRALAALLHEKRWDDIVVKEILARADVGRSTFYTHFRDKDALLSSGLHDTLCAATAAVPNTRDSVQRVFWFSLPLLQHIEGVRSAGQAALTEHAYEPLHAALERALVDLVAQELRAIAASRATTMPALPLDLIARQIASTFLLTLEWWVGSPEPCSAHEADDIFRSLAAPALEMMQAS